VHAWISAIVHHPIAYLEHRFSHFAAFLQSTKYTVDFTNMADSSRLLYPQNPLFVAASNVEQALATSVLFEDGLWFILIAAILLLTWRLRGSPPGAFAVGIALSATVYVLTFLGVGVA